MVAEKPKAEMDALIDEADGLEGLEIITRSGSPTSGSQLDKVSASYASEVVVLRNSESEGDVMSRDSDYASEVATMLQVCKGGEGLAGQNVVFEANQADMHDTHPVTLALRNPRLTTTRSRVSVFSGNEKLAKIMANSAMSSSFWQVIEQFILDDSTSRGEEKGWAYFAIQDCPPPLRGKPFSAVFNAYQDATLVGYWSPEKIDIAPKPSTPPPENSKLLFVGSQISTFKSRPPGKAMQRAAAVQGRHAIPTRADQSPQERQRQRYPRRIMIVNADLQSPLTYGVISSILDCAHAKARITVVQTRGLWEGTSHALPKDKRLRVKRINDLDHASLVHAGVEQCDSLVLLQPSGGEGGQDKSPQEKDAESLITALYLADIFKGKKAPNMVFSLQNSENAKDIQALFRGAGKGREGGGEGAGVSVMSGENVISSFFALVSRMPVFDGVLEELFSSYGSEIYAVDARDYLNPTPSPPSPSPSPSPSLSLPLSKKRRGSVGCGVGEVSFSYQALCDVAMARHKHTPIGYIEPGEAPVLNPSRARDFALSQHAKLVVIAE